MKYLAKSPTINLSKGYTFSIILFALIDRPAKTNGFGEHVWYDNFSKYRYPKFSRNYNLPAIVWAYKEQ